MSSFDIKRVRALFLYDWMLEKRRIGLTALIALGLYVVIGWFIWSVNTQTWLADGTQIGYHLPQIMLRAYCAPFFVLLAFCSVFFVTPILQRKFAKPQTATAYLTLPGTMAEKYWVMLVEYLLGFVACIVAYLVCFYGTALVGSLIDHPDTLVTTWEGSEKPANAHGWFDYAPFSAPLAFLKKAWEFIMNSAEKEDSREIMTLLRTLFLMTPFIALFKLGYYLVLNMLFRTYGQIKSILCYLGTQMCLNMLATFIGVGLVSYISALQNAEAEEAAVVTLVNVATGLLWLVPVLMVGMYYLLYRLMLRKQAK